MSNKRGVLINGVGEGGRNFLKNLMNGGGGEGVGTFKNINKRREGVVGGTNEVVISR